MATARYALPSVALLLIIRELVQQSTRKHRALAAMLVASLFAASLHRAHLTQNGFSMFAHPAQPTCSR